MWWTTCRNIRIDENNRKVFDIWIDSCLSNSFFMVLKSFYDVYYFFLLQMEKEFCLMKTELKIEAITERWTDSLQILKR